MENLSHSRQPNMLSKKSYNGSSTKSIYDDVFGGPPKFRAPTLSPRVEDYSEIFGGFHSSRASSIPVLDLPVVDEATGIFFDTRSSGFDYGEVFGGFNGHDFAVSYEELMMEQSNGQADSSDDEAWTPAEADNLSEELDQSAKDQGSLNGDSHELIDDGLEFNISYNKASRTTNKDLSNRFIGITQHHDVSGYTFVVDKTTSSSKTDKECQFLQEGDDDNLNINYSSEMSRGRYLKKVMSHPANGSAEGWSSGNGMRYHNEFLRNSSLPSGMFVTISDVSLRTQPSDLPPPSRPPPALDDRRGDSGTATPSSKSTAFEETAGDCSPPYFDVEVDVSSSAAVSAAAMKEAMEKAQAKIRSAKESMERKREGFQRTKSCSKNDRKDKEEKVSKLMNDSDSGRNERGLVIDQREDNGMDFPVLEKQKIKKIDLVEGKKHVNVAPLSAEGSCGRESSSSQGSNRIDAAGEWKEATQFFELVTNRSRKFFGQENNENILVPDSNFHEHWKKETVEALQQLQENDKGVKAVRPDHQLGEYGKKSQESNEAFEWDRISGISLEANKLKVDNKVEVAQEASRQEGNDKKIETYWQHVETEKKPTGADVSLEHVNSLDVQQKECFAVGQIMTKHKEKGSRPKDYGKGKGDMKKSPLEKEDCERRPRKAFELEENEKFNLLLKQAEDEKRLKKASEWEEKEKRIKAVCKQDENEKLQREAYEREENEKKEVHLQEENQRRLKEVQEKEENERRLKEIREKEELQMRKKEAVGWEGNEKREMGACEREENEKRQTEAHRKEESEKRLQGVLEKEEKERRLKETLEQEERQRKLREAVECEETAKRGRKENEMRQKEALEKEENVKKEREKNEERLKEACEKEENERRVKVAAQQEQNGRRQSDARETEENERKQKELDEKKESEMKCKEASEKEGTEQRIKEMPENKVGERIAEVYEQQGNWKNSRGAQERKGSETVPKEDSNPEDIGKSSQAESKWEGMQNLPVEAGESVKQKGLNDMAEDHSELNVICMVDEDKNHQTTQLHGKHERNHGKLEGTAEIACEEISKKFTELRNGENEALPGMVQRNLEHDRSRFPTEDEKIQSSYQVDLDIRNEGKFTYERSERGKNTEQMQFHLSRRNKDNFMSTGAVKESVENGRKTEVAQPAISEIKGSTSRTGQQVNASQSIERKVKNSCDAFLSEDKEAERLKRDTELERERLRKIEEEREREREREKDRMAVDIATLETRERAAVERATAEARQRALNEARERLEKACTEAREKTLPDKVSADARLRAERAAVERATAEARERAFEKAMAERAAFEARERVERSVSDKFFTSSRKGAMRSSSSSSDLQDLQSQGTGSSSGSRYQHSSVCSERFDGVEGESAQRCKARLERYRRTAERAAKALAEKNMRDLLAQREQAERNRLAETLDADVKRWSSGKEGNLRALLSTLQYILGPDSGWQPIPLTEVITAAAVKKAYRKATLCVHPDKLQQRGANIQQKYICEKVFDLLKEAWNKFNSEER